MTPMPPRSWLFVPADSEKKIAKALDSDADAIIFDLEDSVAAERKAAARDMLKALAAARRRAALVGADQPARQRASQGRPRSCSPRPTSTASSCPRPKAAPTSPSSPTAPAMCRSTPSSPKPRPACSACCQLPRRQGAAGGDELGRRGSVGGAWRLVQI